MSCKTSIIIAGTILGFTALSASIDGVDPQYNYEAFLIKSFSESDFFPRRTKTSAEIREIGITQGYDHYLFTEITCRDSLLSANIDIKYHHDSLYHGSIELAACKNHFLDCDYFSLPHKQDIHLSSLILSNTFPLLSKNQHLLTIDNTFNYLFHHSKNKTINLTDPANHTRIGWQHNHTLSTLSFYLPHYNNDKHFRWEVSNKFEKKITNNDNTINSLIIEAGISGIHHEQTNLFPSFSVKYNIKNRLLFRIKVEEQLHNYPLLYYFQGINILWPSQLPEFNKELASIPVKNVEFLSEYLAGHFSHILLVNLFHSQSRHNCQWTNTADKASFSLINEKESKTQTSLVYSLTYKNSFIKIKTLLGDRIALEPLMEIFSGIRLRIKASHSLFVQLGYHRHQNILQKETDYESLVLTYRLATGLNEYLETSAHASTLKSDGRYWDEIPAIWLRYVFGY